jgi:hypothetical protein
MGDTTKTIDNFTYGSKEYKKGAIVEFQIREPYSKEFGEITRIFKHIKSGGVGIPNVEFAHIRSFKLGNKEYDVLSNDIIRLVKPK